MNKYSRDRNVTPVQYAPVCHTVFSNLGTVGGIVAEFYVFILCMVTQNSFIGNCIVKMYYWKSEPKYRIIVLLILKYDVESTTYSNCIAQLFKC